MRRAAATLACAAVGGAAAFAVASAFEWHPILIGLPLVGALLGYTFGLRALGALAETIL